MPTTSRSWPTRVGSALASQSRFPSTATSAAVVEAKVQAHVARFGCRAGAALPQDRFGNRTAKESNEGARAWLSRAHAALRGARRGNHTALRPSAWPDPNRRLLDFPSVDLDC